MSPAEIRTLLHIYAIPRPLQNQGEVAELLASELIQVNNSESGYMTTRRGDAMVRLLTSTPLPELEYVDPRTSLVVKL